LQMASAFVNAMDSRVLGENGAAALSSTGKPLVDLFFSLVRGLNESNVDSLFKTALAAAGNDANALADLVVLSFQTRDCRGGKGEKSLFYSLLVVISRCLGEETVNAVLPLVPEYGYWKDLLSLIALKPPAVVAEKCLSLYAEALKADEAELNAAASEKRTPKLSLAGKYAPREKCSLDRTLGLASQLALRLHGSAANKPQAQRRYRKLIASLNAALNTTEVLMAARRYAEIRFTAVASLCLQRHRKAFLNELVKGRMPPELEATGNRNQYDEDRVAARNNLRKAMASKTVKGKQLMPHEIAAKLMLGRRGSVSTMESELMAAQWSAMREGLLSELAKAAEQRDLAVLNAAAPIAVAAGALESVAALQAALPKTVDLGKLVALVDVSASMRGQPMEVAIGLGILVSECAATTFKDRVLTFESSPTWVDMSTCDNIAAKVAKVQAAPWGGSTDFAAAYERILAAAQAAKLKPDDIPDLLVLSDMQFNEAGGGHDGYYRSTTHSSWSTAYEHIERRFAEVGVSICGQPYPPPRIIFWNLRANTVGFPVAADAPNVQMLAGFSPALLKLVLTGAELVVEEEEVVRPDGSVHVKRSGPTPEQTLRAALDDPRYDAIRLKLSELGSGPLALYTFKRAEDVSAEGDFDLVDVD